MPFESVKKVNVRSVGYQQIDSAALAVAVGLTCPTDQRPSLAVIRCETAGVRYRDDGTNPTATVGMPMAPDETLEYNGPLDRLKFIRTVAGAQINVSYYQADQ